MSGRSRIGQGAPQLLRLLAAKNRVDIQAAYNRQRTLKAGIGSDLSLRFTLNSRKRSALRVLNTTLELDALFVPTLAPRRAYHQQKKRVVGEIRALYSAMLRLDSPFRHYWYCQCCVMQNCVIQAFFDAE